MNRGLTRRWAHVGATALVAGLMLLVSMLTSGPAAAEEARSVQVSSTQGRNVTFLVYLDPAFEPSGAQPEATVVVAGQKVPSEARLVKATAANRNVILILDTSGSMRGPKILAAKQAAKTYLEALPEDVKTSLITFNSDVTSVISQTGDRAAMLKGVDEIQVGQKTALFDGIAAGLQAAPEGSETRLLVLSDGGDTVSKVTGDELKSQLGATDVAVDVIAISPNATHEKTLRDISGATDGQYILAENADQLTTAFEEAAASFGNKVQVRSAIPVGLDASGKFAIVTVNVDGNRYTGTAQLPKIDALSGDASYVPPPSEEAAPPVVDNRRDSFNWAPLLLAIFAALAIGAFGWVLYTALARQRAVDRTKKILPYAQGALVSGDAVEREQFSIIEPLDEMLSQRPGYPRMQAKLDNIGWRITPGSWLLIRLATTVVMVLVMSLLFANALIGVVVGIAVGWLGTRAFVQFRENKVLAQFDEELPDFLLLLASSMRSGLSLMQALDATAVEGQGQVGREIRRAMGETRMGASLDEALSRVAERMDSDDMRWVVTALSIQREVGGNLSNILETAALLVIGRAELRREIRSLSAEGRLSGWVLAMLPVGVFIYLLLVNREYVSFFWTSSIGVAAVVLMLVLFITGFIWVRRMVRIKV